MRIDVDASDSFAGERFTDPSQVGEAVVMASADDNRTAVGHGRGFDQFTGLSMVLNDVLCDRRDVAEVFARLLDPCRPFHLRKEATEGSRCEGRADSPTDMDDAGMVWNSNQTPLVDS